MKCLFTPEQLASLNHKEIIDGICKEFEYDDFKWQKEKGLHIKYNERAKGLQKELESKRRVVQQSYQLIEMKKEDKTADAIREKLKAVNPDDMSPREAWAMLCDLSDLVKKDS